MPWKDAYTISDETSLADKDLRWPEGKRCAVHIVVDLSIAGGSQGITARDIKSAPAEFGATRGSILSWRSSTSMGLEQPSPCRP